MPDQLRRVRSKIQDEGYQGLIHMKQRSHFRPRKIKSVSPSEEMKKLPRRGYQNQLHSLQPF